MIAWVAVLLALGPFVVEPFAAPGAPDASLLRVDAPTAALDALEDARRLAAARPDEEQRPFPALRGDGGLEAAIRETYRLLSLVPPPRLGSSAALPPAVAAAVAYLVSQINVVLSGDPPDPQAALADAVVFALPFLRGAAQQLEFHYEDPLGLVHVGGTGRNTWGGNRVHALGASPSPFDPLAVLLSIDLGGDDLYDNRVGGANPWSLAPSPALGAIQANVSRLASRLVTAVVTQDPAAAANATRLAADALLAASGDLLEAPGERAVTLGVPVSIGIDLGGNDHYRSDAFAQGAGVGGGIGILLDLAGNDRYEAGSSAQGCGLQGTGILVDVSGNDHYSIGHGGQGVAAGEGARGRLVDLSGNDRYVSSLFSQGVGVSQKSEPGLLLDANGNDLYLTTQGQGLGINGGTGLLVDLAGDDQYDPMDLPDPTADVELEILLNFSALTEAVHSVVQGVGIVGEGVLYDGAGDDTYGATLLGQGATIVGGKGALVDATGDDTYRAVLLSQAMALFGGSASIHDREGDDGRTCVVFCQAVAFNPVGFPATPEALLVDAGGSDAYACVLGCQAMAAGPSLRPPKAKLVEMEGDDVYAAQQASQGYGGWSLGGVTLPSGDAVLLDLRGFDRYVGSPGADGSRWSQGEGNGFDVT